MQGASAVQTAGVRALHVTARQTKTKSLIAFRNELRQTGLALIRSRPTEPGLRTAVRIIWKTAFEKNGSLASTKKKVLEKCNWFESERQKMLQHVAQIGAHAIPKNAVVLTHCHSHTVEEILKTARKKIDRVYCTETRPLFQGRITAINLSKAGIDTVYLVDSAASITLKNADLFLTGADAILANGNVVNKIGTNAISLAAQRARVPHWVTTSSHTFDPLTFFGWSEPIEERGWKEVWSHKPKKVRVLNPAFDQTPAGQVKKIISEYGALSPKRFVQKASSVLDIAHDKKEWIRMLSVMRHGK